MSNANTVKARYKDEEEKNEADEEPVKHPRRKALATTAANKGLEAADPLVTPKKADLPIVQSAGSCGSDLKNLRLDPGQWFDRPFPVSQVLNSRERSGYRDDGLGRV